MSGKLNPHGVPSPILAGPGSGDGGVSSPPQLSAPVLTDSNGLGLMLLTPHAGDTVSVYTFYSCAANGTNKVQVQTGASPTYQTYSYIYFIGTVGNGTNTSPFSNCRTP